MLDITVETRTHYETMYREAMKREVVTRSELLLGEEWDFMKASEADAHSHLTTPASLRLV